MENALRACCKGIKIGKILVHRCGGGCRCQHQDGPYVTKAAVGRAVSTAGLYPAGCLRSSACALHADPCCIAGRRQRGAACCCAGTLRRRSVPIRPARPGRPTSLSGHAAPLHCCWAPPSRIEDRVMEQEIVYEKLPADIAERFVLVMDPILGTGGSAARAVKARRCRRAAAPERGRGAQGSLLLAAGAGICGRQDGVGVSSRGTVQGSGRRGGARAPMRQAGAGPIGEVPYLRIAA